MERLSQITLLDSKSNGRFLITETSESNVETEATARVMRSQPRKAGRHWCIEEKCVLLQSLQKDQTLVTDIKVRMFLPDSHLQNCKQVKLVPFQVTKFVVIIAAASTFLVDIAGILITPLVPLLHWSTAQNTEQLFLPLKDSANGEAARR